MPSIAVVSCVMACAILVLAPTPAPAEDQEVVEGGEVVDVGDAANRGMSASNPRVKTLLASHPKEFVTICVAGCAGKPAIVQALPRPVTARTAEMLPSSATIDGSKSGKAGKPVKSVGVGAADVDAVTCIAGCNGSAGLVVQRMTGLPTPLKAAPKSKSDNRNEPLDVR